MGHPVRVSARQYLPKRASCGLALAFPGRPSRKAARAELNLTHSNDPPPRTRVSVHDIRPRFQISDRRLPRPERCGQTVAFLGIILQTSSAKQSVKSIGT